MTAAPEYVGRVLSARLLRQAGEPGISFPVDYCSETSIDRLTVNAQAAYIVDLEDIESVRCAGYGRHQVYGNRQAVVLESGDRLYISPEDDCVLEFTAGKARLLAQGPGSKTASVAIKRKHRYTVTTGDDVESLFGSVSALCAVQDKLSPWRSHPFFRQDLPDVSLMPAGTCTRQDRAAPQSPSTCRPTCGTSMQSLRYPSTLAPLSTSVTARQSACAWRTVDLPAGRRQFERWAGRMLSRSFQADCAVRYACSDWKTTGRH